MGIIWTPFNLAAQLLKANNLSDLANKATALVNLGVDPTTLDGRYAPFQPTTPGLSHGETMPRIVMSAQNVPIGAVTGTVFMTAVNLHKGDVVTNINFITGTTAANTPTHWWAGLSDGTGLQVASSADQLTTAIGANTAFTIPVVTPYTVAVSGFYFYLLSVTATANPTLSGHASVPGSSKVTPILGGVSGSPAQSTPGTDGVTTYALPTGDNAVGYFYSS